MMQTNTGNNLTQESIKRSETYTQTKKKKLETAGNNNHWSIISLISLHIKGVNFPIKKDTD